MRVDVIKNCKAGGKRYRKGERANVKKEIGWQMVEAGVCRPIDGGESDDSAGENPAFADEGQEGA